MSSFMSFKHTSRSELIVLVVKCRNMGWKDLYDLLERGEMHADFSGGDAKGTNYMGELGEYGRIILEWRIENEGGLFNDAVICKNYITSVVDE